MKYRDHPNMKIIWFEDMKTDLAGVIRDVTQFLDRPMSDKIIDLLVDHLHIDNFRKITTEMLEGQKNQKAMVEFFRKGQIGDWKNYLDEKNNEKWNKWMQENIQGIEVNFKFE